MPLLVAAAQRRRRRRRPCEVRVWPRGRVFHCLAFSLSLSIFCLVTPSLTPEEGVGWREGGLFSRSVALPIARVCLPSSSPPVRSAVVAEFSLSLSLFRLALCIVTTQTQTQTQTHEHRTCGGERETEEDMNAPEPRQSHCPPFSLSLPLYTSLPALFCFSFTLFVFSCVPLLSPSLLLPV